MTNVSIRHNIFENLFFKTNFYDFLKFVPSPFPIHFCHCSTSSQLRVTGAPPGSQATSRPPWNSKLPWKKLFQFVKQISGANAETLWVRLGCTILPTPPHLKDLACNWEVNSQLCTPDENLIVDQVWMEFNPKVWILWNGQGNYPS